VRPNPAYDVAAIKRAARAAGHPVYSVKNGTGSLRGEVVVSWPHPLPDPVAMSRASEWLRATFPGVPFIGLKPREFCDYWLRYSAAERKAKDARPSWGVRGNPRGEARVLRRESQERPAVVLSLSSDGRYIIDEHGTRYGLDGKPLYDGSFHVEKPANRPPKRNPGRAAAWLRWFATLDAQGAIEALDPYGNRDPEDVLREARRILASAPKRNPAKKAPAGWPVQVVEVHTDYDYDALSGPFMETDRAGIVLIDGRAVNVPPVTWVRYRAPGVKYVGTRQVYAEDSMPWRSGPPPRVGDTITVARYPKFPTR